MGCWITKEHKPENNYLQLGYDYNKFRIVKMIFDDFDLNNTNRISICELESYNTFIKDFFFHRLNHLENHYELNNDFKRNKKLTLLGIKDLEMKETIIKMNDKNEILKMEISNTIENRKGEIKLEIKKLEQELVFIDKVSEIKKKLSDDDTKIQIENMKKSLQIEKDTCMTFYDEKCKRINDEKESLESLLNTNNPDELRAEFLKYMTGSPDKKFFTLLDILLYFKNKSYDDTLLLLKYINKGKYNDIINEDN
jgi:hypothetical protein